jgi:hypothetical protein
VLVGSAPALASLRETMAAMEAYRKATGLRLEAESIIVEDGMAVAVHTLSDRVIPVVPTKDYEVDEAGRFMGVDIVSVPSGDGPSEAARVSVLGQGVDEERVKAVEQIKAYNDTYGLFRSWVRAFLLRAKQVPLRKEITKIMKANSALGTKLRLMQAALGTSLKENVIMVKLVDLPPGTAGGNQGKFYIPAELFTFDAAMLRLADEILRFPSASKFILGRSMFYSTQAAEYIVNKDELILPESMLVPTEENARGLNDLLAGNLGPSAAISQNSAASAEAFTEPTELLAPPAGEALTPGGEGGEPGPGTKADAEVIAPGATGTECSVTRKSLHPSDKLIKRHLMPRGTQLLVPVASQTCIWNLVTMGISSVLGSNLTVRDVTGSVTRAYKTLSDGDSQRAILTWRAERKLMGRKRVGAVTGEMLSGIAAGPDYAASNIDLFYLAKAFGVTLVIISSKATSQTGTEVIAYSGLDEENLLKRVVVLKRGQKGALPLYSLIVSEAASKLDTVLPAFAELIKENLLPQPYHMPPTKVVREN